MRPRRTLIQALLRESCSAMDLAGTERTAQIASTGCSGWLFRFPRLLPPARCDAPRSRYRPKESILRR